MSNDRDGLVDIADNGYEESNLLQKDYRAYGLHLWKILHNNLTGIKLCMRPANERRRYIVTSSLIGWVHTQNDPCTQIINAIWSAQIFLGRFCTLPWYCWWFLLNRHKTTFCSISIITEHSFSHDMFFLYPALLKNAFHCSLSFPGAIYVRLHMTLLYKK